MKYLIAIFVFICACSNPAAPDNTTHPAEYTVYYCVVSDEEGQTNVEWYEPDTGNKPQTGYYGPDNCNWTTDEYTAETGQTLWITATFTTSESGAVQIWVDGQMVIQETGVDSVYVEYTL